MSFKGEINNLLYKCMPGKQYLKFSYWWYHKKTLSLTRPQRLSEKLYLLKVYNGVVHREIIQECYDKYKVRNYIEKKIGKKYLTDLYGVWDNAYQINFNNLPDKCIFKISQSCGSNLICKNGYKSDEYTIKGQLDRWLREEKNASFIEKNGKIESYYNTPDVVIICEELLENPGGDIPDDIRLYCIKGKVAFITVDYDTVSASGEKMKEYVRNVYSPDGIFIDAKFGRPNDVNRKFEGFENLHEMIYISEKLSEDFEFVRVDLYNVKNRIYFGELTWIPMGGAGKIEPAEFDLKMGQKLKIDNLVEVVEGYFRRER
ncbi:MAG: ATP-grasp fold amidoligase family protein [Clostridiales bacterium]|nr:ATP-grasp fold amidoligase family protein [Clostridiales bacterium]MDY4061140.1 ATP-grasp fold amidoligase family protein [Anaerovoracaceae bacterium]